MAIDVGSFDRGIQTNYQAEGGYCKVQGIPLNAWINSSAGTLQQTPATGAGIVGYGAIATNLVGWVWNATADNADQMILPWQVPSDFHQDRGQSGRGSKILVRVKARKRDTTGAAADNGALALTVNAHWHSSLYTPGTNTEIDGDTTVSTLGAAVVQPLNASAGATDAVEEKFRWYTFDVTASMTAAQRQALKAGATMKFTLAPNVAVGAALAIDVLATEVWYTGHMTLENTKQRDSITA